MLIISLKRNCSALVVSLDIRLNESLGAHKMKERGLLEQMDKKIDRERGLNDIWKERAFCAQGK